MPFDIKALNTFSNVNLQKMNAIVNIGEDGKITKKGSYHGKLGRMFRIPSTKAANNAVRTELLRSLGNAFGLEGMGQNKDGVMTFSKEFMTKLAELLGSDLKIGDFGIAPNGRVASGKPLTQRRINAIIKRAEIVGEGKLDIDGYKAKLAKIKAEVAKLPSKNLIKKYIVEYYDHVGKCLDFLENEIDHLIIPTPNWKPGDEEEFDTPPFTFKDPKTGKEKPMKTSMPLRDYLSNWSSFKGLYHFENYNFPYKLKTQEDVNLNLNYVRGTTRTYVQGAIDLYLDAKKAGKLPELFEKIRFGDGCMDGRASNIEEFRQELGLEGNNENASIAKHDGKTTLDRCIYEEIKRASDKNKDAKGWADLAEAVKKELIGKVRPIMTLDENDKNKIIPLMENGKPVIRKIKEADIDTIGQVCADNLGIF